MVRGLEDAVGTYVTGMRCKGGVFFAKEVDGPHGEYTGRSLRIDFANYEITPHIYYGADLGMVGAALWKKKE